MTKRTLQLTHSVAILGALLAAPNVARAGADWDDGQAPVDTWDDVERDQARFAPKTRTAQPKAPAKVVQPKAPAKVVQTSAPAAPRKFVAAAPVETPVAEVQAERPRSGARGAPWAFSAIVPEAGRLAIALGAEAGTIAPYPRAHLGLVAGLGGDVAFELQVRTHLTVTDADVGFRYRVAGNDWFNLALRTDLTAIAFVSNFGFYMFGGTPGLMVSFGQPSFQISLGVDAPIYFAMIASAAGETGAAFSPLVSVRPFVAAEFALDPAVHAFVRLSGEMFVTSSFGIPVTPTLLSATLGVSL